MLMGTLASALVSLRALVRRLGAGALLAALLALSLGGGTALATPPGAPLSEQAYYLHASACVAAIKQDVLERVAAYRPGQTVQREDILRLTEQSFAFVGTAYKMGLRNPQAEQLLDEAEQRHTLLSPPAQRKLSQQCQTEGAGLVADANMLERLLVRNRAAARVNKLLPTPLTTPLPTPVSKP